DRFAIQTIDLGLKGKIGSQPFVRRGVHAAALVPNDEGSHCRFAIFVTDSQSDRLRGLAGEQNRHFIAKAEILCSLPYIERDLRFSVARVAAVELNDAIFEFQSAQLRQERLLIEHHQVEPPSLDLRLS